MIGGARRRGVAHVGGELSGTTKQRLPSIPGSATYEACACTISEIAVVPPRRTARRAAWSASMRRNRSAPSSGELVERTS